MPGTSSSRCRSTKRSARHRIAQSSPPITRHSTTRASPRCRWSSTPGTRSKPSRGPLSSLCEPGEVEPSNGVLMMPIRLQPSQQPSSRDVAACLEALLVRVRHRVNESAPELASVLNDYFGEARFGASVIHEDLVSLPGGAPILEIGAGMMLLSCALQHAGFAVTAIEPVGEGFAHLGKLRQIVMTCAAENGDTPDLRLTSAEHLDFDSEFEFAFSINVMEHVQDVSLV